MKATRIRLVFVLVSLLLVALVTAEAQHKGRIPRIAVLTPACRITPAMEAFFHGLRDAGYEPGSTITVERHCFETADRLQKILAEVVEQGADVILASGNNAAEAAKSATTTIPIVMSHGDPVGSGLVASLARPGGNITGLAVIPTPGLWAKRVELVTQMNPHITRVAMLFEPAEGRNAAPAEAASRAFGVTIQSFELRQPSDLDRAFTVLAKTRPGAVVAQSFGGVVVSQRRRIIDWATQNRLPTVFNNRIPVDEGALVSYGPNIVEAYRHIVAGYVAKVLKGTRPADLPIQQPTRFELVINVKTAKVLGLTIPPSLLVRADQVIE